MLQFEVPNNKTRIHILKISPNDRFILVSNKGLYVKPSHQVELVFDLFSSSSFGGDGKEVYRSTGNHTEIFLLTNDGFLFVRQDNVAFYHRFATSSTSGSTFSPSASAPAVATRTRVRKKATSNQYAAVSPDGAFFSVFDLLKRNLFVFSTATLLLLANIPQNSSIIRCVFVNSEEIQIFTRRGSDRDKFVHVWKWKETTETITTELVSCADVFDSVNGRILTTERSGPDLCGRRMVVITKREKENATKTTRTVDYAKLFLSRPTGDFVGRLDRDGFKVYETDSLEKVFSICLPDANGPLCFLSDLSGVFTYAEKRTGKRGNRVQNRQIVFCDFVLKQKVFDFCGGLFGYDLPPYVLLLMWDVWSCFCFRFSRHATYSTLRATERLLHSKKIKWIQCCLAALGKAKERKGNKTRGE